MLKMALFDRAINENCCSVDGGQAFAVFFCPHPGGFDSSRVPTPRNLPSKVKKVPMPGGHPGGRGGCWAQVELADALDPSQIEPPILSLYLVVPFSLICYCFLCCFFFSSRPHSNQPH